MLKKTGFMGGLFCLIAVEATAATYICDNHTVTDQPWKFQNCINTATRRSYADEKRAQYRAGIFAAPAKNAQTPSDVATGASRDELLKGRQRKRLDQKPTDTLAASCLSKWRDLMEDPESPEIVSANVDEVKNQERPAIAPWYEVVLEIKAKNSKGEAIQDTFVCGVASTDQADDQTTQVYQTWFKLGLKFNTPRNE